jgi:P4 family phage/plasmid primase-like protien
MKITLSVGDSRHSQHWVPTEFTWEALVDRMRVPIRTSETVAAYADMSKDQTTVVKDVGGYVGGRSVDGTRKAGSVTDRQLLALDADFAYNGLWEDWLLMVGNAALVHSTHGHTHEKPRLRLLVPLSRPVTAEEYAPIGRRVAEWLGMDYFDDTTYEANRLMFWPSCPLDGEYIFDHCDGPILDPDQVLDTYEDWHDITSWPRSAAGQQKAVARLGEKQGDPLTKPGMVGAFNRAYSVSQAIETFLSDRYEPCGEGRYTYTGGSTVGGAVLYDNDTFLFSHHDTDPISGRLCSAYDLVRLHLYGDLDNGEPLDKCPSTKAMHELCAADEAVREELVQVIKPEPGFERLDDLERFVGDMSEQGLAGLFVDAYGRALRHCDSLGWMVWNGTKWVLDASAEVMVMCMAFADDLYRQASMVLQKAPKDKASQDYFKRIVRLRSASGIKNLMTLVSAISHEPNPERYDAFGWDLNTPEGIIDLKTGELRDHDLRAKCTKVTAVGMTGGDEGKWKDFLAHITGGDKDFERYLQTLAGMAAVGEVYEEGLVISHGSGGNGKSTFFGALRWVLGDYAKSINPDVLVTNGKQTDQSYVAALRGARLAILSETEEGAHFSVAQMKRLTSRDAISARSLYKDPIEFNPTHTTVMHTNHLPRLDTLDGGTKRRIGVAWFPATMPPAKVITNYEQVLVSECGPAILRWIVEGARMFHEAGCKLVKPPCVIEATRRYMEDEDWLGQFIEECCEEDAQASAFGGELYNAYQRWAGARGDYVRRGNDFARALEIKGYVRERTRSGALWRGLRLREEG